MNKKELANVLGENWRLNFSKTMLLGEYLEKLGYEVTGFEIPEEWLEQIKRDEIHAGENYPNMYEGICPEDIIRMEEESKS